MTINTDNNVRNLDGLEQEELDKILFEAIDYHNLALASSSIKSGANINPHGTRSTPLINAVKYCNSDIVSLLLSQPDIDINLKDSDGLRAIDYANNNQLVLWLLGKGADPSFNGGRLSSYEAEKLILYFWTNCGLRKHFEQKSDKSKANTEAKNG